MEIKDLEFWGQGTRKDNSLYGWPGCKQVHPMTEANYNYLGCYFNNDGINMMHDEFFDPMASETKSILNVAKTEGPDISVTLHSHGNPPAILKTCSVPEKILKNTLSIAEDYYSIIEEKGHSHYNLFDLDKDNKAINLSSAIYHISGATSFTYECPHGLKEKYQVDFKDILELELDLYQAIIESGINFKN